MTASLPPLPPDQPVAIHHWHRLAKMMARRGTDLIAIAIVAAGILSISGRLSEWWSTDPADLLTANQASNQLGTPALNWGEGETPVSMRLGQLPVVVHRQIVQGDQARAWDTATSRCRDLLSQQRDIASPPFDAAVEGELLRLLKDITPIEEEPGRWRLYRVDQNDAMMIGAVVIGVRVSVVPAQPDIACWGLVVPRDNVSWTVFLFDKSSAATLVDVEVPLPPRAKIVMSLADPTGGHVASFECQDVAVPEQLLAEWRAFFSAKFTDLGWQIRRDWSPTSVGWSASFERPEKSKHSVIDLYLRASGDRRVLGVASRSID